MVRRSVLGRCSAAGRDWCITEDAELGLRVFHSGLRSGVHHDSYGKGLMPDTFIDFKQAAFPLGLRRHADQRQSAKPVLGGKDTELTRGQRVITSSRAGCRGWRTA